jgi:excisionase family DNA binding protein
LEPCGGFTQPKGTDMAVAKNDHLLTPAEVATLFKVTPKTVTRWAVAGKLSSFRTLGGHRRYRASDIRKLFDPSEWAAVVDITDAHARVVDIRDAGR